MRDKITEILNLIKVKKFKEAQIKCEDIKKHFDENTYIDIVKSISDIL